LIDLKGGQRRWYLVRLAAKFQEVTGTSLARVRGRRRSANAAARVDHQRVEGPATRVHLGCVAGEAIVALQRQICSAAPRPASTTR
jgi:hypothetical protein